MKKFFLGFMLSLVLCSCNDNGKTKTYTVEEWKQKNNTEYSAELNFFGDSLTDHFPKYEPRNVRKSSHLDTGCYHNTLSYQIALFDVKTRIDSILNLYKDKFIGIYKATDSCLLVVNDYVTDENCGDPFRAGESTFINGCSEKFYPVLNFWSDEMQTNETRSKLPKDFVFYVIDSKAGVYSKKINLEQSSMPEYIRHGFSRGYAISKEKNILIYWVVVW